MGWGDGSGPEGFAAGESLPPIDASSGPVVVPDANLLFTADYTRAGDDLLLTGADGTTLVISNYFALDAAPILFSPDGAMMVPQVVGTLVASQTPRQFAQAGEIDTEPPIGEVQDVSGTAAAIRDGVPVELLIGDPVFQNDVIQTGLASDIAIGFADGTIFTLASNARIVLDGMIYDPAGVDNSLVFSIVQGTFSFVTGQVAPTGEMLVKTPVATIGIRGTIGLGKLESALGPLSFMASRTEGGPATDVTFEDPLTGAVIADISNPAGMYQIARIGDPVFERPATVQELFESQSQSNALRGAQANFRFSFEPDQPIYQPDGGLNQRGDAGDTGNNDGLLDPAAGPSPLETAAGVGPGQIQSGGIGFDRQSTGGIGELSPTVSNSDTQLTQTTSPPPAPSTGPVAFSPQGAQPASTGPQPFTAPDALPPTLPDTTPATPTPAPPPFIPPQNANPVVASAAATPLEEAQSTPLGLTAPSDADGDPLIITVEELPNPAKGAVALANGTPVAAGQTLTAAELTGLQFNAAPNAEGPAGQFVYSVSDGTATVQGAVTIAITPVNDPPSDLLLDVATIAEDAAPGSLVGTISAVDPDLNDPKIFSLVDDAGGRFVIDPQTGEVSVNAALDFETDASHLITVLATDSGGLSVERDFTITVGDVDDEPPSVLSLTNDIIAEDSAPGSVIGTVSATDPDSASHTFSLISNPGGLFAIDPQTGALTLTGALDFEAATSHQVIVRAIDPGGNFLDSPFTINVSDVNESPVAQPDAVATDEDTAIISGNVLLDNGNGADSDPEGDTLTVSAVNGVAANVGVQITLTSGALLNLNANGTFSYDPNGQFEDLGVGDSRTDSFTYSVIDGNGGSDTATATVTVDGVNDAPLVDSRQLAVNEDSLDNALGLLAPSDVDGDALIITVEALPDSAKGTVTLASGAAVTVGQVLTAAQLAGLEFDAVPNATGAAGQFEYSVFDGTVTVTGAVDLSIRTLNDAPVLGNNRLTIDEGASVVLASANLSATDVDNPDADLIFTVAGMTGGQFELVANPGVAITQFTQGDVTSSAVQFVHGGGEAPPAYTVTVSDGTSTTSPAAAVIDFTNINDAPVLGSNSLTLDEGGTVVLSGANLSATDADDPDPALLFVVGNVTGGQFELVVDPGVAITQFTQGDVTAGAVKFVHDGGEAAPTYTVTVSDGTDTTAPVAAAIDFTNTNDAPIVDNQTVTVSEDSLDNLLGLIAPSDVDGDPLTITVISLPDPDKGEVTLASGVAVTLGQVLTPAQLSGLQYDTLGDADGPAGQFVYAVFDGTVTVNGTVDFDITPVNDTPVLGNNTLTVSEGETVVLSGANLSAADVDNADPDLIFTVAGVAGGQFEFMASPGVAITQFTQGEVTASAVQFVHNGGETAPSYTVTVNDGTDTTTPVAAVIDFTNVNDAPVLGNNALTLSEGGTVVLSGANLGATDIDNNDPELLFTVAGVTGGQFELVVDPGVAITQFTQAQVLAGTVRFLHDGGETAPSYSVTVGDGTDTTAPVAAAIDFANVNDAPILGTNFLRIEEGETVVLSGATLSATDADDPDPALVFAIADLTGGQFEFVADPGVAITQFTQAQVLAGAVRFLHDGGETAPSYSVTVSDGTPTAPRTAEVAFSNVNDVPVVDLNGDVAGIDVQTGFTEGGGPVVVAPLSTVLDPDSASLTSLTVTLLSPPDGTVEVLSATSLGNIIVTGLGTGSLTLSGGVSLADYQAVLRTVTYDNSSTTPTAGLRTIQVQGDDGSGLNNLSQVATAAINVGSVNNPPVLGNNSLTLNEGETVAFSGANLSATDADNPNPGLVFTVAGVTGGQFELVVDPGSAITQFTQAQVTAGAVHFAHDGGEAAPSYTVTVSDGTDTTAPVAASINFTNVNDAPVLGNNTLTIDEGATVVFASANLSATDVENPDTDLIFTVAGVTGGQFELVANSGVAITQFTQGDVTSSAVQFVHDGGEAAPAYTVIVSDGTSTTSPAAALIDFTNINDAPVLGSNSLTLDEGGTVFLSGANLSATDADDADPGLTFAISGVTGGQFELVANPGVAAAQFTQAQVTAGEVQFVHDGGEGAPTYSVTVSDGINTTAPVTAAIAFSNVNDTPVLGNNILAVNEGATVVLTPANLSATDLDNADPALIFAVTGVTGGQFEFVTNPGVAITQFTQAQVTASAVQFVHDGGETAPTYAVTASDGTDATAPVAASILFTNVDDAPVLGNNALTLSEGGTVILSSVNMSATDVDNIDPALVFAVAGVTGGRFELVTNPGVAVTQFTQAQVTAGAVQFVHDGGEAAPAYMVTVSDGINTTAPVAAGIGFTNVNDAPVINLNGTDGALFTEQSFAVFVDSNLTISDADNTQLTGATVTIGNLGNPGDEVLDVIASGSGIDASFNANTGILTLSGAADVSVYQQVLRTVTYSNNADDPTLGDTQTQRSIRYVVNDGIAASAAAIAVVDLSAVNDAPVNAVPGAQSKATATDLVLSGANGNALSVADVDAGANVVEVTLSVANGALTLASIGGLTSAIGMGTANVILTGTLVAINAALAAGVTYSSTAGFVGIDTLSIVTNDLGNTGVSALSDTDSIEITVSNQTGDVILQDLTLVVGDTGTGTFSLSNGANLLLSTAIVGNTASGIGTLDVTGAGTALNVTAGTSLTVGAAGTGTMNINSGATTTVGTAGSDASMTIGDQATGVGTVTVNAASLTVNGSGGLAVGNLGRGTLKIENGALVESTSDAFNNVDIGRGAGGDGTVVVTGVGSTLRTLGTDNTIQVGRAGTGTFTAEAGATVETLQFEVGRSGTGTATFTGAGTTLIASNDGGRFSGNFDFEAGFVRAGRNAGSDGTLNILAGADVVIRSGIGVNEDTTSPGLEIGRDFGSSGTVFLDGVGSRIDIIQTTPDNPNFFGPYVQVGLKGQGALTVSNQAELNLNGPDANLRVSTDSTANLIGPPQGTPLSRSVFNILSGGKVTVDGGADFGGVRIGDQDGGDALALISGLGSNLTTKGVNNRVDVGWRGQGELLVGDQATISTLQFEVGRFGAGVATIEGAGTKVTVSNDNGRFDGDFVNEAGFVRVGRFEGSDGTLNVLSGGVLEIREGQGVNTDTFGPALYINRDAGSSGAVLVSGVGSRIDITQSTAAGDDPNVDAGPTLRMGQSGGEGTLTIEQSGQINLTGESAEVIVGDGGGTHGVTIRSGGTLNVDGTSGSARLAIGDGQNAVGDVTVSGPGSAIALTGNSDSALVVGNEGHGTLFIEDGGAITVNGLLHNIANAGGSRGEVHVDVGAQFNVNGALTVGNGFFNAGFGQNSEGLGLLEIYGGSVTTQSLDIGGALRGVGIVTVDEGGSLTDANGLNVGGAGNGTLNILDGTVTANGAFNSIANGGGSTGLVTLRGPQAQLAVNGEFAVGNGFVDADTGFGTDRVPTNGTLQLFGGGIASISGNLTVAAPDVDVTGSVLVSGISELNVGGIINIGTASRTGVGLGSLTIQNGLVPVDFFNPVATNLTASGINVGTGGTLNLGKGSIHLPGAAAPGTLTNDGILNLGQGPGIQIIVGNYTQGAGGVLNLRLGEGGNGTAVFGTADFGAAAPTVNLNRISGPGGARFGDSVVLAASTLIAGAGFDLSSVTINQLDSGGLPLNDGLDVYGQDVSFDGLPEAIQFTTVTDQTSFNPSDITGGLSRGDGTDELITGDVTDSDIQVLSTVGNQSLLAINGDIFNNNVQIQTAINVSGGGNTLLALNGDAEADFVNVGQGGSGSATLIVGSAASLIANNSVIVGDRGTGQSELFVHGALDITNAQTSGLILGNVLGTAGRLIVDGGGVEANTRVEVGLEGDGVLDISNGGVLHAAGDSVFVGNAAGSSGAVTVTGDGSRLVIDNAINVANGFFDVQTGFGVSGAATSGKLDILQGGFVSALDMNVGVQQNATGTVLVDGVGSTLTVGNATVIENILAVGSFGKGTGSLTVQNGGTVNTFFLAAANGPGPNSDVFDGAGGATGTITVTGVGSRINVTNDFGHFSGAFAQEGGFLRVGRMDGDVGRLDVLDGALLRITSGVTESAPELQIARNPGSQGTVIVDNAEIEILQSGPADDFGVGPFLDVGRSGKATMEIRNNAEVLLSGDDALVQVSRGNTDAFADPNNAPVLEQSTLGIETGGKLIVESGANLNGADIVIGTQANANGVIVVDGSADLADTRSEILLSGGAAGQQAAFFSVGLRGTGVLSILGGARVLIDGEAGDFPGMNIGGGPQNPAGGTGVVLVDGPDSALEMIGLTPFFAIGNTGTGTLTVSGGGQVILSASDPVNGPDFDIGFNAQGVGAVIVAGAGSSVVLQGLPGVDSGSMDIGRLGQGSLGILDGGTVSNALNGVTTIGREVGASGTVLVQGTSTNVSTLNAGAFLLVGMDFDYANNMPLGAGTGGTGTLTIGEFGTVNADQIFVGTDGAILGTGTGGAASPNAALNGALTVDGGTVAAGFSAGTLGISGDFVLRSGVMDIELGGTALGQSDLIDIAGAAQVLGGRFEFQMIDGYVARAGDEIVILNAAGGLSATAQDVSLAFSGVTADFQFAVNFGADAVTFTALNDATPGNGTIFLGGDLADVFVGGDGDDVIFGGGGADILFGNVGADSLTGGLGADIFALGEGDGGSAINLADVITDFEDGADLIGLTGGLSFAELTTAGDGAGGTVVSVTATAEILVVVDGITPNLLDDTDFTAII